MKARPADWPSNPYLNEIKKLTDKNKKKSGLLKSFIDSIMKSMTGQSNPMITLTINRSIVDYRDVRIIRYLQEKKKDGVDLNTLF